MAEMKQQAWDFETKVDQTLMESRNTQNRKMYKFVEILIREFKYLNQVAEDKILHKVGFYERFRDPASKKRLNLGYLYDEIYSAGSAPSFSFLKDQDVLQRAHTIGTFKPPKVRKRIKKKIRYTQSDSDKGPNSDEEEKTPKEPSRSQITVPRNPLYDLNFEEERVW